MGVVPRVDHFKVAMHFSVCIGLWPLVSSRNKAIRKLYEVISKLHYFYFNIFCFTQVIQLAVLLMADSVNYAEVANNLAVFFVYFNSALRCKAIKGKAIRKVITEVGKFEKKIRQSMDDNLKKIYYDNVKRNNLICSLFAGNTILTSIIFAIWPLFMEKQTMEVNNATVQVRYLPISAWLPFDVQEHYVSAYILLVFNANYLSTMFFISTEALAFGLMTYPLGQIHMLKHVLRNFRKYKDSLQKNLNLSVDTASEFQLQECILKHQGIIQYIDVFNAEMKHTYLLDFLQCSIQLTCVLYRFMTQRNLALVIINIEFISIMLIRLFITYWTANEVILQSQAVSDELYYMEWLDETVKLKKMMMFMMMRGQRPLKLFIGIFKAMSLEVFIAIIKITYSYISLFYRHR